MLKLIGSTTLSLCLLALTACGQPEKKETSETAGLGELFRKIPASATFNLAEYIKLVREDSPLSGYVHGGNFLLGQKSVLAVENNFIIDGSQKKGEVSANYFLIGSVLKSPVPIVDIVAKMKQKPAGGSYSIQTWGKTVREGKLNTEFNHQVTRDFTIPIPGTQLAAVGFYGEAGVGGELAIQGIPAIDPLRGAVSLNINPFTALHSRFELGASLASGLAKAGLNGVVRIFETTEPMFAEMGLNSKDEVFGSLIIEDMDVKAMGGTLEATLELGLNDILPVEMQGFWKKYLAKEWKWEILSIPPTRGALIPGAKQVFGEDI